RVAFQDDHVRRHDGPVDGEERHPGEVDQGEVDERAAEPDWLAGHVMSLTDYLLGVTSGAGKASAQSCASASVRYGPHPGGRHCKLAFGQSAYEPSCAAAIAACSLASMIPRGDSIFFPFPPSPSRPKRGSPFG